MAGASTRDAVADPLAPGPWSWPLQSLAPRPAETEGTRLRVRAERCSFIPRGSRCSPCCQAAVQEMQVRVREIDDSDDGECLPYESYWDGQCGANGIITFGSRRCFETHVRPRWHLRFEVVKKSRPMQVLAYAKIQVLDLARQPRWNLLLSDPTHHDALYRSWRDDDDGRPYGPEEVALSVRRPCFLELSVTSAEPDGPEHVPGCGHPRSRGTRVTRRRVMILTRGTRGDVQPFVALARGLILTKECEVTIVTELKWKQFIIDSKKGLPKGTLHFRPSGGDTMSTMETPMSRWALRTAPHVDSLQALCLAKSEQVFFPSEGCFFYWAYEEAPELIVFGFTVTNIAMLISERLNIKIAGFFLQPVHNLQERRNVRSVVDQLLGPIRTSLDSTEFNAVLQKVMHLIPDGGPTLNNLRVSRGLQPFPNDISDEFVQYEALRQQNVPQIVPINPAVLDAEAMEEMPRGTTPTDFIFLRGEGVEELDADIQEFISKARKHGRRIAVMSFSSMPVEERKMLQVAIQVCEQCSVHVEDGPRRHRPALIVVVSSAQRDVSLRDDAELQEQLRQLTQPCAHNSHNSQLLVLHNPVPFGALFKEVDAAILHGGLGVTSEALLAGLPIVTSGVLLMDQRYWAARVAGLGCGPDDGISIDELHRDLTQNDNGTPIIVEHMNKALDPSSAWKTNAEEKRDELLRARTNDDTGVTLNAQQVFARAEATSPVSDPTAELGGCCRCWWRQARCLVRCSWSFVRCLTCRCLPHCAIMQLRCLRCLIYLMCLHCCRRRHIFDASPGEPRRVNPPRGSFLPDDMAMPLSPLGGTASNV